MSRRKIKVNVRELIASLRTAIQRAVLAGDAEVKAEALDPDAGRTAMLPAPAPSPIVRERLDDTSLVLAALTRCHGNVAQTARAP